MRNKRSRTAALMCIGCIAWVVYAQPSSRPGTNSAQLLAQGRFGGVVDDATGLARLPLLFSWPASSVYTSFTGDTISATSSALSATAVYDVSSRFRFYVDGKLNAVESTDTGNTVVKWKATSLGPGEHNLTIIKLSEAAYGQVSLDTLTLNDCGRFLTPTLPAAFATGRRIMFIGDSFTVGLGNMGTASTCIPSTAECSEGNFNCHQLPVETEDASMSWGPLTAVNFTADYQVIAWSGSALAREPNDHPDLPQGVAQELSPSDIELFGRQVAGNKSLLVDDHSAWIPQINQEFGNPDIITMVYPAEAMLQGILDATQAETYRSYMFSLHNETQAAGMTNVHQLVLDVSSIPLDDWCSAHPSAAADASIAAQLSAFIVREIPQWPSSTHPVNTQV